MKVNEKLSILFLLEKAKKDKDNKCPITIRITIDGKRAEISLGKKMAVANWDQEKGCGVGTAREVFALGFILTGRQAGILFSLYSRKHGTD